MKNDNLTTNIKRPRKKILNKVNNRFLPISESVLNGLEPEPTIEDFKIQKEIGSGSFGIVYLATHLKTKVDYAIKAIDKRNKTNIEGKPYFRREIEIMYKIRHPNCVRLFGNFEDENFCYFIMEYVPGGNLYTLMASNKNTGLNIYLVASIMRQLISAIFYLHNMNPPIIHRDIKPENVLLTNNSKIKLTDFGWSNYINIEGEQRLTFCGTPIYLAPEMILNKGHDKHVDIWCLGVLLFELLTGTPPFIGQNRNFLMKNIINVNIVWPTAPRLPIDPDAKDLISKILKKIPSERISLENMVKHNFFLKYCPKVKPILNKNHIYHLKPFIVSKEIPKDDYYDYDVQENENYEFKHPLKYISRTSFKKNKFRDITPSPPCTKLYLDEKCKSKDNNIINNANNVLRLKAKTPFKVNNYSKQIDMPKGDDYETIKNFEMLRDVIKENEELEKENENLKLREKGYNLKIEELTFALNNLSQENMLLKIELDKHKKELEKIKKEMNILYSSRNVNLNLNNQTTYNINTSNTRIDKYKGLKTNSSRKKNNNTIIRPFISKTPEGLQHKAGRILMTNPSHLKYKKPYLKKNPKLNKSNISISNEEEITNSNSNSNLSNSNKRGVEMINIQKINKNNRSNDIAKVKEKKNKYYKELKNLKEKEDYKSIIKKLQIENDSLKAENQRIKKNNHKSLNRELSPNAENKNY